MTRQRLLIFVPSNRMGGAERVLKTVAYEAAREGYTVDIVCLTAGTHTLFPDDPPAGVSLSILSNSREINGVIAGFREFVHRRKTRYALAFSSHVHCNAFLASLRTARILKCDYLVCRESTQIGDRFRGFRRLFYRFCYALYRPSVDLIICQTNAMKASVIRFSPWLRSVPMAVLPNPVSSTAVRRRNRPPADGEPVILSVGRLIREKGYDVLIEAFGIVKKIYPGARLQIYGEGPLRADLVAHVEKMGLQGSVALPGATSSPVEVMAKADVCVVSSRNEGFPNTLLEMMQANNRVVSTLCAEGIDQIRGLVTSRPGDARSLAEAIMTCIREPASARGAQFDLELEGRTAGAYLRSIFLEVRSASESKA